MFSFEDSQNQGAPWENFYHPIIVSRFLVFFLFTFDIDLIELYFKINKIWEKNFLCKCINYNKDKIKNISTNLNQDIKIFQSINELLII